ncbi:MAG: phenylalanine--tRNA ligase subunit alpha [Spirochaetales bacterium]|nr:phenylalanine--tRNA ligase subunit alpha [Spirochaetales bacterium]
MELVSLIKGLHPLEVKVLLNFDGTKAINRDSLTEKLNFNTGQSNQAMSWLVSKELIEEKERATRIKYELTDTGRDYQKTGTPEERILGLIKEKGPHSLPEMAEALGLENKDIGSAFGSMSKSGVLQMNEEKKAVIKSGELSAEMKLLRKLLNQLETSSFDEAEFEQAEKEIIASNSKKRGSAKGIFKIIENEIVTYALTHKAAQVKSKMKDMGITGDEIGLLSPEIIHNQEWKKKGFRSYNINVPPSRVLLGRKNPYVAFLEEVKDKLVSMGFQEFDGPLTESEFWNSDALFMPQFHAARDIHDVFYLKEPTHAKEIEQPYLDNVAKAHENGWNTGSRGWGYQFDRDFTRRMILRSQGTVLSAKALTYAEVPGKYFGIERCFRYDSVDATHAADFYQTEGIVLGNDVNLRTLLGLLKIFAEQVAGAKEVKYVPAYFPFTEPSVEVHIKHDVLGWFELGGSGIFRPEVTEPLGIKVPVLAWGLGIDRMALMSLGLNDIRDLFTNDIEQVRLRRRS